MKRTEIKDALREYYKKILEKQGIPRGKDTMMIRSFFRFYGVWREKVGRWRALHCAWSLVWMNRKITREIKREIKKLGSKEYIKQTVKKFEGIYNEKSKTDND